MTDTPDAVAHGNAIRILDSHRIMAIATNRPDGWPQTTIVGYANIGLLIYFMVFRSSQKLANIERDPRVSIAVGHEPTTVNQLEAVYAGALASEVTAPDEMAEAWRLLSERHPNLATLEQPPSSDAAIMMASCKYVSVLDYDWRFGHSDAFVVDVNDESVA